MLTQHTPITIASIQKSARIPAHMAKKSVVNLNPLVSFNHPVTSGVIMSPNPKATENDADALSLIAAFNISVSTCSSFNYTIIASIISGITGTKVAPVHRPNTA